MTTEATTTEAAPEAEATTETDATTETTESEATSTETEGEKALGDAGKKALDAMKVARNEARKEAQSAKAERDALQAKIDGKEAEFAEQQKARETERAALAKADERILKAEVRALAATRLEDPADALRFIDLSEFEVDSDGAVDGDAIAAAIDDLISTKPYLSAQGGKRFQGTADGGARNDAATPKQLKQSDIDGMSPAQIDEARENGLLADLMSGKK